MICIGTRSTFLAFFTLSLSLRAAFGAVFFNNVDELPQDVEYDFIIAGGGTGGGVVGGRLAENRHWKILVIEAGPSNTDIFATRPPGLSGLVVFNPLLDWNYTTTPQQGVNDRTAPYYRGKLLGGCSSHNGLGHTRGSRDDWNHWAEVTGDEGLKWDNMLRIMIQGEKFVNDSANLPQQGHIDPTVHGYNGNLFVSAPYTIHPFNDMLLQVTKELPNEFPFVLDVNGGTPIGISWAQFSEDHNGTRSSSATAYIETSQDNLHVLLNTYVTRVFPVNSHSPNFSDTKQPDFRGVEFAADVQGKKTTLVAKKEVIVAGGVIGTPQILLNSGIGSREELEAFGIETIVNNPSVGKNFTDQVSTVVMFNTTIQNTDIDPDAALAQWNATHTGPLVMPAPLKNQIVWVRLPDDTPALEGFKDPSPGHNAPHIEVYTAQISATAFPVDGPLPPHVNGTNTVQLSVINLHPASRGSITLSSSSPFSPPIIDTGLLSSPLDLAILREGIRSTQHLFSAPVFKSSVFDILYPPQNITTNDKELDEFIRADAGPYLHGGCSAMMSPKGANWGVVDPDFRVKGARSLRVVDASVFPSIPSGHTQAQVYGLAERASRLIRDAWV